MIEFAVKNDTEQIITLWNTAFPEEPDFNAWFFKAYFKAENCLVLREDGIIKAMAQLLPYEIKGIGKASYIYGAATHPMYRKQGLMTKLLRQSFEIDKERGFAASILIPQGRELFDFYAKIGYKTCFYVKKAAVESTDITLFSLREAQYADIEFMDRLYRADRDNYIVRDEKYWQTQLDMFKALGGSVYILLEGDKPRGYAFVSDGLIQESFGDCNGLASLLGLDEYTTCGVETPFGMAYAYEEPLPEMYMNLMFN